VSTTNLTTGFTTPRLNSNGLTVGGLGGYNYGFNGFVLGLEGEVGYDHRGGNGDFTAFNGPGNESGFGAAVGRFRGRIGWGWDRWLLFAAGGGSITDVRVNTSLPALGLGEEIDRWRFGWNIGGGLEWAFADHWTLRGEYIYDSYGNRDYNFNGLNPAFDSQRVRLRESTARAALTYRF
jgi:outer membrane immunogenic protein